MSRSGRARALLVQPPVYDFAAHDLFLQPFGLMRIGRWLSETGYEVGLFDCLDSAPRRTDADRKVHGSGRFVREPVPTPAALRGVGRRFARYGRPRRELEAAVRDFRPDVVCITTGMTYWYPGVSEVCTTLSRISPSVPVVAGGVYATLLPAHCAGHAAGPHVVRDTAADLPPLLASLGLPAPEGPLPDMPSVDLRSTSRRLIRAAAIRLREGCPYQCVYCASPVLAPRMGPADPDGLVEHIAELSRRLGIRTFAFYDDALLAGPGSGIVPFLEGVIRRFGSRTVEFYLPNAVHLDFMDGNLAELMYDAGFAEIRFGLESIEPGFHSSLDSKIDLGRTAAAVESMKSAGFAGREITAYVLMGLPGQGFESVRATLAYAERLGINVSVAEYSPVPGTMLYEAAAERLPAIRTEPLLHNNSAYGILSGSITHDQMSEVRSTVRRMRENPMV